MKKHAIFLFFLLVLTFTSPVMGQEATPPSEPVPGQAPNGVIVSTPNADGSIVHIVRFGDTLYAIAEAYGIADPSQIMVNTGNSPDAVDLREGDRLIIRLKFTVTPTNDWTPTPRPITPQPTKIFYTPTPTATRTPSPTPTETPIPPLSHQVFGNSKTVGSVLIGVSALGLLILLIFGFIKKN